MRAFLVAVIAAGLTTVAMALSPLPPPALTMEGYGPVKVGMTRAQAESALGAKLEMFFAEENDPNSCGTGKRADGKNPDVYYLIEDGRVARVEIVTIDTGTPTSPPIRTAKGIGLGATEAQVKAAYGASVKVTPHTYLTPKGHYMTVMSPDGKRAIVFETDGERVIAFRGGRIPQVEYIEGCA
jgi:hypothetical protein